MSWFLDGLAFLFILFLGYNGFKRGFIEELGRLLGLALAILISISNSANLSIKLNEILPADEWMGIFLSFALLFTGALFAARVLTKLVQIALLSKSNQLMNGSLGFIFGSIKGCFILMVFVWFIAILPLHKWTMIIEENSRIAKQGNKFRSTLVSFFNWDDPVSMSESYIKQLTQP
jgi:membrane protein required for colicin V production